LQGFDGNAKVDRVERIRNKVFSVEEANALIPYLERALGHLAELATEVTALRREIEILGAIESAGADSSNPDVVALRGKERACSEKLDRFRGVLSDVTRHGCIVRDLEMGLVDFYAVSRGRVICLCWRRGEPRVAYWHGADEGFAGRRPLDDLLP
jgi:hypothetical protein